MSSNNALSATDSDSDSAVLPQSFIPPISAGVEIVADAQPSRAYVDGAGAGDEHETRVEKGKGSSRSESSDAASGGSESGAVTVSFKPSGEWAFMDGKDVEDVEVVQHIGGAYWFC